MREPDGHLVSMLDAELRDLVVEKTEPRHAKVPGSFVLTANGQRYQNTKSQRRKARKVQKQSRKKNR